MSEAGSTESSEPSAAHELQTESLGIRVLRKVGNLPAT